LAFSSGPYMRVLIDTPLKLLYNNNILSYTEQHL